MTLPAALPTLRCGIIRPGSGTAFPAWQARCLEQLLAGGGVTVALLLAEAAPPSANRPAARPAGLLWRLCWPLYAGGRSRATQLADSGVLLAEVPVLSLPARGEGAPPAALAGAAGGAIRAADLDFILHFGHGPLPAGLLEAPRYGVWAFAHGEGTGSAPLAPFWEVYRGETITRAALCRLAGSPGGGEVLYEGFFKTITYSYWRNRDEILFSTADWPAAVCGRLRAGGPLDGEAATPPAVAGGQKPTGWRLARLLLAQVWRCGVAALRTLSRADEWNIGVVEAPIETFLRPGARPPVRWLPAPPLGRFLADPFPLGEGPAAGVLAEAFDYRSGKGRIATLAVALDGALVNPQPAIEEPEHLSYPYVVAHEGALYCLPETHQAREVRLYRATATPRQWTRCATIVTAFAAADATVFRHNGRWWLLCSEHEGQRRNTTLHAWYATALDGPWTPHAANPLKTDVRSSRPAGAPFVHAGQLYRPAQECSRTYGGAVTINRVLRLTPAEFAEEPVALVAPDPAGPYPHGLHTLSAWGQRTLIDGKRTRFIPWATWQALRAAGGGLIAYTTGRMK